MGTRVWEGTRAPGALSTSPGNSSSRKVAGPAGCMQKEAGRGEQKRSARQQERAPHAQGPRERGQTGCVFSGGRAQAAVRHGGHQATLFWGPVQWAGDRILTFTTGRRGKRLLKGVEWELRGGGAGAERGQAGQPGGGPGSRPTEGPLAADRDLSASAAHPGPPSREKVLVLQLWTDRDRCATLD